MSAGLRSSVAAAPRYAKFAAGISTVAGSAYFLRPRGPTISTQAAGHFDVVIVGGGCAGAAVGSQLLRKQPNLRIAYVEPSEQHFYQPGWTLVGGGLLDISKTVKEERDCLPRHSTWVKDRCVGFAPEENLVLTQTGKLSYETLVVCPGIELKWDQVKGLRESLGKNSVTSNYSYATVPFTREFMEKTRAGHHVFTSPACAIKCGGAPLKACFLVEDFNRQRGTRADQSYSLYTGSAACFAAAYYRPAVERELTEREVQIHTHSNLVEVRGPQQEAVFDMPSGQTAVKFDFLHVTPPMGPWEFVAKSPLANSAGFVAVDKSTLQHERYQNVFALGDASSLPTSKTAAAACGQARVVAANLLQQLNGESGIPMQYSGYSGCPITVSNKAVIMAEFGYDGVPMETLPWMDQREPSHLWFHVKRDVFPAMYWMGILNGFWRGPSGMPRIPFLLNNGQPSMMRP